MILETDRALVQALLNDAGSADSWEKIVSEHREFQQRVAEEWSAWAKSLTCREDLNDVLQRDFLESSLKEAAEKLEGCLERAKAMQRLNEELEDKIVRLHSQIEDADRDEASAAAELDAWKIWAHGHIGVYLQNMSISRERIDKLISQGRQKSIDENSQQLAWDLRALEGRQKSIDESSQHFQQLALDLRAWVEWAKARTCRGELSDAELRKVIDADDAAIRPHGELTAEEILFVREAFNRTRVPWRKQ